MATNDSAGGTGYGSRIIYLYRKIDPLIKKLINV